MSELQDPLYSDAVMLVRFNNEVSTSFIQRKLRIGYNRAARLIETMERNGVVTEPNYKGERKVVDCE